MMMTGGEVIAKMLSIENVEKVFGIIDGTYFGLYSCLEKYGIQLITPRHETCAAHMAGAYAKLTGKLGVCIASNGPGVANILPGIVVENAEGNRVLLITSSRRVGIGYPDRGGTFQYFNQVGVITNTAKWSETANSFSRIPELMRQALRKSFQGRPGVVHLDVAEDVMNTKQKSLPFQEIYNYRKVDPIHPSPKQLEKAVQMLISAKKPLIHVGNGAVHSGAFDEIKRVAKLLHAPVTTSWAARSVLPETIELNVPMYYISANNKARNLADVVLILGSRVGETDWWGKAPYWALPEKQQTIQVDIDEDILGGNKPTTLPIFADIKTFLAELYKGLDSRKSEISLESRQKMLEQINKEKKVHQNKLNKFLENPSAKPIHSAQIPTFCRKIFDDDAVLVIDGGNTAIWATFYHQAHKTNTILSTHKFGMLGAGIAQALGAAVARPKAQVYCIIGDGAMGFHPQEIETAIRNNLKVIYIVLCDKQWGMVKINQMFALRPIKTIIKKSLDADETINADLGEIAFDKLAESMGAHGERTSTLQGLEEALERSLAAKKCAVIHVDVDPEKHMWAPNLIDFKNMHQEPKGK